MCDLQGEVSSSLNMWLNSFFAAPALIQPALNPRMSGIAWLPQNSHGACLAGPYWVSQVLYVMLDKPILLLLLFV